MSTGRVSTLGGSGPSLLCPPQLEAGGRCGVFRCSVNAAPCRTSCWTVQSLPRPSPPRPAPPALPSRSSRLRYSAHRGRSRGRRRRGRGRGRRRSSCCRSGCPLGRSRARAAQPALTAPASTVWTQFRAGAAAAVPPAPHQPRSSKACPPRQGVRPTNSNRRQGAPGPPSLERPAPSRTAHAPPPSSCHARRCPPPASCSHCTASTRCRRAGCALCWKRCSTAAGRPRKVRTQMASMRACACRDGRALAGQHPAWQRSAHGLEFVCMQKQEPNGPASRAVGRTVAQGSHAYTPLPPPPPPPSPP